MSGPPSLAVEYTDESGARYRVVFERAANGAWERTEYERRGCEWRAVGSETVTGLSADGQLAASAVRTFCGP